MHLGPTTCFVRIEAVSCKVAPGLEKSRCLSNVRRSKHVHANSALATFATIIFVGPGRCGGTERSMTTRPYARLVSEWIGSVGLDPRLFGTHLLRRTKATLIYRRTGNLRAVQLPLGHAKIESTVRVSRDRSG